jgi:hypothetical protein
MIIAILLLLKNIVTMKLLLLQPREYSCVLFAVAVVVFHFAF